MSSMLDPDAPRGTVPNDPTHPTAVPAAGPIAPGGAVPEATAAAPVTTTEPAHGAMTAAPPATNIGPQPVSEGAAVTDAPPVLDSSVPGGIEAPTESHALATADHHEKGAVQNPILNGQGEDDVKDLGWHEVKKEEIPNPLVGGIENDELWVLIRRFNKQMYHAKSIPHAPPGGLDLNRSPQDEFSPDKLRSNIERLYMTVIVGMVAFIKHVARLRSWKEWNRTAAFCAVYFAAWTFDLLAPTVLVFLATLIVYEPSRTYLFPPAPIALVDASTGGIQKPKSGMLGSHSSLTGAPEKHKGEAVEQEAHNFVSSFGAIALSSTIGKKSDNEVQEEHSETEKNVPDPTEVAMTAADANQEASGNANSTKHDKAKQPMEEVMWDKVRPVMRIIGDIADVWERFANALSPTPPFHKRTARRRFGAVLIPVIFLSLFVTPYMMMKSTSFIIGAAFFGGPVIDRVTPYVIQNYGQYMDIRNTLLKGVPTNAQLTLTLLRLGEARKAPLPPPPSSAEPGSSHNVKPVTQETVENLPVENQAEVADAVLPDTPPSSSDDEDKSDKSSTKSKKHHPGRKIISFFKGATKTGVNASLSTDPVRAQVGSRKAQNRLGAVPKSSAPAPRSGPVTFPARHHGKRGAIELLPSGDIRFIFDKHHNILFQGPIDRIKEIKKTGGLGWKSKLVVGWSLDRDVIDGLEIVDDAGQRWLLTAVHKRDELFNRLIAMGPQKWESW